MAWFARVLLRVAEDVFAGEMGGLARMTIREQNFWLSKIQWVEEVVFCDLSVFNLSFFYWASVNENELKTCSEGITNVFRLKSSAINKMYWGNFIRSQSLK